MRRALLLLALWVPGCGDPEPTDTGALATNELSLQVWIDTDEVETRVAIGIYAVGHAYARLSLIAGEKLLLRIGGSDPIEFAKEDRSGFVTYNARVPLTDGSFTIDLERGAHSARGTLVTLPPAFTIATPTTGLRLDQPFTIAWSPAVPTASVKASIVSDCVRVTERTLAHDSGSFTWSAADYADGTEQPPCTATIKLKRNGGSIQIAPELASVQSFRAEQHRAFGVLASRP
jgi:hypothetical protein